MPATLARATPQDAHLLDAMQQAIRSRTYAPLSLAAIEQAIAQDVVYLIRSSQGELAGYFFYKECGDHVLLDEFGLLQNFRGQGIGRDAFAQILAELKGRRLELITHPENPAARLYQSFGFVVTGRIENFYGDGEPRQRMVRA